LLTAHLQAAQGSPVEPPEKPWSRWRVIAEFPSRVEIWKESRNASPTRVKTGYVVRLAGQSNAGKASGITLTKPVYRLQVPRTKTAKSYRGRPYRGVRLIENRGCL